MKKILIILLIFLCLACCSFGSTWYVRPFGTDYGAEDGEAYATAWEGLEAIVWGGAGVVAGDTLYICGLHVFPYEKSPSPSTTITVSGTAGSPIIIRGDASSVNASYEDGYVWGHCEMGSGLYTWTDEGANVYSNLVTTNGGYFYFEDITKTSWTMLTKTAQTEDTITGTWTFTNGNKSVTADGDGNAQAEIDDGDYISVSNSTTWYEIDGEPSDDDTITLVKNFAGSTTTDTVDATTLQDVSDHVALVAANAGSYYSPTYKYDGSDLFYVHCSDSGDPTDRVAEPARGYRIRFSDNTEYITFKNFKFGPPIVDMDTEITITNIRFENCVLWYRYNSFRLWDGVSYIEFVNCDRAYGLGGFSMKDIGNDSTNAPHHITISGCTIHDLGIYAQNVDEEGVGTNGVDDLTIESCEFYNCGTAHACYPFTGGTNKNLTIRWNYIHDTHESAGGSRGTGIELGYDQVGEPYPDCSGAQVYGNVVANVPNKAYHCNFDMWMTYFYNNLAYNCGESYYFNSIVHGEDYGPTITLKNNISLSPTNTHILFTTNAIDNNYQLISDYNLFYPDGAALFTFGDDAGITHSNFAGWQSNSEPGCTFDGNSLDSDPTLRDITKGKFVPLTGSPAIGGGTPVGLTRGRRGGITTNPPDIGSDNSGQVYLLF